MPGADTAGGFTVLNVISGCEKVKSRRAVQPSLQQLEDCTVAVPRGQAASRLTIVMDKVDAEVPE